MRVIELDFLNHSRRISILQWCLLVIGATVACTVLYYDKFELVPRHEQLQAEFSKIRQSSTQPVGNMNEEELTLALQNAKEVSRKLSFPWGRLFTTLGLSSVQKDLALVSVEPDANAGQLVVVGEARNFRAMLYFLHALQASPMFEDVFLQSHYINHTIEENPIRFRLLAKWSTSK